MKVVIIIPVFRNPSADEMKSLQRCCEVLSKYDMALVCPSGFDCTIYHTLWNQYELSLLEERFNPCFFDGIAGYNRLLLSQCFYERFKKYDYMLIYQPDAYIFEDRLVEWCSRDYDFVGAPLVGDYQEKQYYKDMQMVVGNGGFCLRKISAYLAYFQGKKSVFTSSQIAQRIRLKEKPYTRWLLWLLMMCGWRNTPKSVANHWKYNEDNFWSMLLDDSNYAMRKPTPQEALDFAFERFPQEMYAITQKMPMGCHAWRKYEYEEFWKNYIK